jgi:hypothetical protein
MMNLGETTTNALLTAAIAGVGSSFLFTDNGMANIGGISLPVPIVIGASAGAGSLVSNTFSDMILAKIPQSASFANAEKLTVKLGLCGASTALALKMTTGLPNENLIKAVAQGAGSQAGGDWIRDNVINTSRYGFLVNI